MELLPIVVGVLLFAITASYLFRDVGKPKSQAQDAAGWVEVSSSPPRNPPKGEPQSWELTIEGEEVVLRGPGETRRFTRAQPFARFLAELPEGSRIRVPGKLPPTTAALLEAARHVRLEVKA